MVNTLPLLLAALASANPTVYLIRHGEKAAAGDGLNAQGVQRAQCLRTMFGSGSVYAIGHVMAMRPEENGKRRRPLDTVKPLAEDLGLVVDTSCDRDDARCVRDVVERYDGVGNILICWEHDALTGIVKTLGNDDAPTYPSDSFDIIWTDPAPYKKITDMTSEKCPGLDN